MIMDIKPELKYTKDHEWIEIDGKIATVGITDYAQGELGDIVYVEIETLDENLEKVKKNILPGSIAFKLYDTYGFPLDLTEDILRSKNIKVDKDGFTEEMEASKKLARANWKGSGDKSIEQKWFKKPKRIR